MDYDKQRTFLTRQQRRLLPTALACALLLVESWRSSDPLWARLLAAALALGLLWSAYYLPNYLSLNAYARRRLRWLARARWFLLGLVGLVSLAARAWVGLGILLAAGVLHFAGRRRLEVGLPADPEAAAARGLAGITLPYAMADAALLWSLHRDGVPSPLLVEFLLAFGFFAAALLRPRGWLAHGGWALGIAAFSVLLFPSPLSALATFLWTFAAASLLAEAEAQNLENYRTLVDALQAFSGEPRETIAELLQESTRRLAEDWSRSRPTHPAEAASWYSRNAHYYLYDIAQHHLLYKHITYTLGLLRLARGRVLDFGGGNGDFSCALARAGFETTYLDVPGESAEFVRWRVQREGLKLAIVHDPAALAGPFEVIFALDVLEHLADTKAVLARWRELLRPGGWLVFTYYVGPASSAPMHLDPGYDLPAYLVAQGFRPVKTRQVGLFSPEYMRKKQFQIMEKPATD